MIIPSNDPILINTVSVIPSKVTMKSTTVFAFGLLVIVIGRFCHQADADDLGYEHYNS
jgi:hypothetical protein